MPGRPFFVGEREGEQRPGQSDLQGAGRPVTAFRTRLLDAEYPYLMLDATSEKVRENGRVISIAVLIATGVKATGEREVVGIDVGPAEDLEFWKAIHRQLVSGGLSGVLAGHLRLSPRP